MYLATKQHFFLQAKCNRVSPLKFIGFLTSIFCLRMHFITYYQLPLMRRAIKKLSISTLVFFQLFEIWITLTGTYPYTYSNHSVKKAKCYKIPNHRQLITPKAYHHIYYLQITWRQISFTEGLASLELYNCRCSINTINKSYKIDKQMRRTVRTNQPELQPPQIANPDHAERFKFGVICLRNVFEGILKRVECQTIGKLIGQCGVYDKKVQKLKFICFFAQHFLRRKKQQVLDKLKRTRQLKHMFFKVANNLALICRRISKGHFSFVFSQLRKNMPKFIVQATNQIVVHKPTRESFRSSRISEQSVRSNIFSVSEDSLASSKVLIFDQGRDYSSEQILVIRRENEQLKKMTLSAQARQCLMKMQRFDRYIYQMESDRVLKEPITKQLRRLQKMKNEYKQMRVKFYDNQLTITCLFNHIKLVYEMNRDITDGNAIKVKIGELQKKMQEMNSQHRKEINEYKKKLMFAGISNGNKERSRQSSVDFSLEDKGQDKVISSFEFTSDEATTFNILIAAIRSKKYKDLRREVDHFIKKFNKEQFIVLLKEVIVMASDIQSQNEAEKLKQKEKSQLLASITLLQKSLRSDKLEDIEKIKVKSKNTSSLSQLYTLTQTISTLYGDLKKLKKKQSNSAQKQFKSAEKDKLKKNIDFDNDQLRKQLKMLQIRYQQLENEKNRLEDSSKKQIRPSIPKRPSLDKSQVVDNKSEQSIKKLQENEATLTKKIETLQKENTQMNLKNKTLQQNLDKKVKDYQAELEKRIEEQKVLKGKTRQFDEGCKYYAAIKAKRSQKQIYQREINEFKRYFPQSIFLEIFEGSAREESANQLLLNQIKSVGTLFSETGWKRKQNILFTEEAEVYGYLNQIIEILLNLSKEKQENLKNGRQSQRQLELLKKRQLIMSEDNSKIKEEVSKIRQQNNKLKIDLRTSKSELQSSLKPKSPEKLIKTVSSTSTSQYESQIVNLQSENDLLKSQLDNVNSSSQILVQENKNILSSLTAEKTELSIKIQQYQAGINTYNTIKTKIALKQPYQRQINDFKRKYPQNIFNQIFQILINAESVSQTISNQLKNIVLLFSDNSWKRKSNIMIKQQGEIFTFMNQVIEILLSFANEKEEFMRTISQRTKELEGLRKKEIGWSEDVTNIKEEAARAKDETVKQRGQISKIRQELQVAQTQLSSVNRRSTSEKQRLTADKEELRSQNDKIKKQFELLKITNQKLNEQIETLQSNVFNLQQQNKQIQTTKLADYTLQYQIQQLTQWKVVAEQREKKVTEKLRVKQNECHQIRQRMEQLQYQAGSCEERLNSYKLLLEKVKSQRDNLRLIIEEKNQQFQTVKQDVEYHEQDKRLSEEKIIELKHSYESTQLEIRKIELQVERLLRDREIYTTQRSEIQRNYQQEIAYKQEQIRQLKTLLDQKERNCLELQGKLEVAIISHRNELMMKDNEREFLQKQIKLLQSENSQLKARLQQDTIDMRQRIDSLAKQLQQSKQDQEQERNQMRFRIQQMNSLPLPTRELAIIDNEKQELRKQLELINQELAGLVRNSQQEKRQLRKYIEQMANEMQMQSVLAGEEKKILREDIERARNEEYQIGHEKIRKLREDIQVLREENERLTSIIDVNEAHFHQLITEHQQMNIRIGQMSEQLEQSAAELAQTHQERQNLLRRLQPLQDKLTEFEEKIAQAMHERMQSEQQQMRQSQAKTSELEQIINQLQEENHSLFDERNNLQMINTQQGRQLIDMHHHIIRMESEINTYQMAGTPAIVAQPKEKEGAYAQYLEEKLKNQEEQLKRYVQIESELLSRVDRFMKSSNDTERERLEQLTFRRDKQIQIAFMLNNHKSQIGILTQRCRKSDEITVQKTKQVQFWKIQASSAKQEASIIEERLRNAEQTSQVTHIQNGRLRAQIEDLIRQASSRSQREDEVQRLSIQNRMLTAKLSDYFKEHEEWEKRINQYEVEIRKIRRSSESKSDSFGGQMEWFKDRGVSTQRQEQLQWLRGQIQIRDQEINRLRSLEISFAALTSEHQQTLYKLRENEQKCIRQANISKEINRQLSIQEENYKLQIASSRNRQQNAVRRYGEANSELELLRQQNRHLGDLNLQFQRSTAAIGVKLTKETGWLREIVRQLGGQYQEGEEEQIEIKILMKISEQIGELVQGNKKLSFRCSQLEREVRDHHAEQCQQQFVLALQEMVANVLSYLKQQELVNPQQAFPPAQALLSVKSSHKLILDVGVFFRDLITGSIRQQQETNNKYTDIISEIKRVIDEFLTTGKRETLTGLQQLLAVP